MKKQKQAKNKTNTKAKKNKKTSQNKNTMRSFRISKSKWDALLSMLIKYEKNVRQIQLFYYQSSVCVMSIY